MPIRHLRITLIVASLLSITCFLLFSATVVKPHKLRHVVAFRFKPEVSVTQMQQVTTRFHALKEKVPQIIAFEGGPDIAF